MRHTGSDRGSTSCAQLDTKLPLINCSFVITLARHG